MTDDKPAPDLSDFPTSRPRLPITSRQLFISGGGLGVVATFLPLISVSIQGMGGMMKSSGTSIVFDDWRGKVSILGYLAALVFAFVLYPPGKSPVKSLVWTAVGVCGVVGLLGIWLLIDTVRARGGADVMGMMSASATPGVGAFVNVLAAVAIVLAAMWKGREQRLF